jgi:hypothetical protein
MIVNFEFSALSICPSLDRVCLSNVIKVQDSPTTTARLVEGTSIHRTRKYASERIQSRIFPFITFSVTSVPPCQVSFTVSVCVCVCVCVCVHVVCFSHLLPVQKLTGKGHALLLCCSSSYFLA